jgi:hypothetical protein
MGFLKIFNKSSQRKLVRLPSGSFTLDQDGRMMTSTLPQAFPEETLLEIGQQVLASFREARKAQMPMAEIIVHYATLKVLARELRGGAMIFLMPTR